MKSWRVSTSSVSAIANFLLTTALLERTSVAGGESGVFDVDELVNVLRRENCFDIVALAIPKHINYVDHIVVASCRSSKHLVAVAEFTKKLFKRKYNPGWIEHNYISHLVTIS